MDVRLIWVGKTKNSSIRTLLQDYVTRIRHLISCEIIEIRDSTRRMSKDGDKVLAAEGADIQSRLGRDSRVVALDERGTEFASTQLARWLQEEQNTGRKEIVFVIGGPGGLSPTVFERAHLRLSLGKMTWPHELCRVLLLEQLYRALSILHNIPYHK